MERWEDVSLLHVGSETVKWAQNYAVYTARYFQIEFVIFVPYSGIQVQVLRIFCQCKCNCKCLLIPTTGYDLYTFHFLSENLQKVENLRY